MKKKLLYLCATFSIIILITLISFQFLSSRDKQFILKNTYLKSAVLDAQEIFNPLDSQDVFQVKVKEALTYFSANQINTVLIPINGDMESIVELENFNNIFQNTSYLKKNDILLQLKKQFAKENVQVLLQLDCTNLSDLQVTSVIQALNKEYQLAGIVLDNFQGNPETLQNIKLEINKQHPAYWMGFKATSPQETELIKPFGCIDLYIFDNIDETQYKAIKQAEYRNDTVLFSYQSPTFLSDLFLISNFSMADGVVLAQYTSPHTDLSFYNNLLDTTQTLAKFDFTVENTFAVTHPSANMATYYGGIFVTGVTENTDEVLINGEAVLPAEDGTFGKYVPLQVGENTITVTQQNRTHQVIVNRKKSSGSSGGKITYDKTKKASAGQVVETTAALTSIIANKDSDSSIMEGVPKGTQLVVVSSEVTTRSGYYTYAYKLSNGGYILAKNVTWIDDNQYQAPTLSEIKIQTLENQDEYILLNSTGKPAVVSEFLEDKLIFTFLNTTATNALLDATAVQSLKSTMANSFTIEQQQDNVVLQLHYQPENALWGYQVEYDEQGSLRIYLKQAPRQAGGAKPLTGVTILLDPGHGGKDNGAAAVGGVKGPHEKELNLAVALATKECLEKFGATVYLSREDDTFLSLDERRDVTADIKPDLFLSMHHNSLEYTIDGAKVFGTEVYYFTPQSKAVAEVLCNYISSTTQRVNRGEKYGYYYVARNDIAPSVLIEYGFLINPYEYAKLYKDVDIYKAAFGTAQAILEIIPQ